MIKKGILYPWKEEKYEKEQNTGKKVDIGISASQALLAINILEIRYDYDLNQVLAQFKSMLMQCTGHIQVQEEQPKVEENSEDDEELEEPKPKKKKDEEEDWDDEDE